MSNLLLPGDPDFDKPIVMGNVYKADPNKDLSDQVLPPAVKRAALEKQEPSRYAATQIAYAPDPWYKNAQMSGVDNMMAQPMWFSPLHTPQNWQIASKRREVYQWLYLPNSQVLREDFTYERIEDFIRNMYTSEIIHDELTGGFLYEDIGCDRIMSGSGKFRRPVRASERSCINKTCYSLSSFGNWRDLPVSQEHKVYVLDGVNYRFKKKIIRGRQDRQKRGIPEGTQRHKLPDNLIKMKEAQDVSLSDYLLSPIPKCGNKNLDNNLSWIIGLLLADGHFSKQEHGYCIGFTMDKKEHHVGALCDILRSNFKGKIQKNSHGKGLRIAQSGKEEWRFFKEYIKGTYTSKCLTARAFDLDKQSRLNLLGGYFDGDGSFTKGSKLSANLYSCDMADQIYWMLISCGIRASVNKHPLYGTHFKTSSEFSYNINIPSSDVPILQPYMKSNKISSDFTSKDNRDLRFFYKEDDKDFLCSPISKIEKNVYTGVGYDLQIDPERSFVASGYVASNCRFWYENEPKVAAAIDFYCFAPDMQVLMADGTQKSISSVKVGEKVRSHTGKANPVVKKFIRHTDSEDILKITYSGVTTEKLKVTPGHKLLTTKNGEVKYVQAHELNVKDCLLTPCSYEAEGKFEKLPRDDFAWLAGVYAAEGCGMPYEHTSVRGRKVSYYKGVKFAISIEEERFRESILSATKRLYGDCKIKIVEDPNSKKIEIRVYGKNIADDLMGICPGTSSDGTKRLMPYVISKWNAQELASFIGGFYDGDGCYSDNVGYQGVGVCKRLCEQVANMLDRLGIEYSFNRRRPTGIGKQQVYVVLIPRRECHKFLSVSCKLDAANWREPDGHFVRNVKYRKNGKYIHRSIIKIEKSSYSGDLYDLEVENDHSYVVNRIACSNSRFPMNGFDLECPDRKILSFYEHHVVKKLKLNERLKEISSEYYTLGDVFIHSDIQCPICGGTAIDPDTEEPCDHEGGKFSRIFVMNPDWIEVQRSPLTDEPLIVMIPDEELQQIVHKRQPKAIYDRIPEHLKPLIMARAPIPLSNRTISHLRHMPVPYGTYGTSIIRRLFTTLAYKTKIMTANWIVAERLILPVRVVKIGSDDRPASTTDIADVQAQLAQTANDPNLTIVTHHNFEYEWYGTSGKVLQITQEMEHIDKELLDGLMLNQALLNGEAPGYMCYDEETEVLTDSGFKKYKNVYTENKIACYNVYTNQIHYESPLDKYEYDYDGEMVQLAGEQIDICVTPNHKMLVRRGSSDWFTKKASDLRTGDRLLAHGIYKNNKKTPKYIQIDDNEIDLETFLVFAGYYLSEGTMSCKKGNYQVSISQSENKNKPIYENIKRIYNSLGYKFAEYRYPKRIPSFAICNKSLVLYLKKHFGDSATNKHIPGWIKNLDKEYLELILGSLVDGDGQTITHKKTQNLVYTSINKSLVDDVQEIAFKCGYNTRSKKYYDKANEIDIYRAKLSAGLWSKGNEPRLKEKHVSQIPYKGKVWCFSTSTGFFVTRRNGKITIQGNSAQVGVETLIRRIESWRGTLAEWCQENIFKPIAEMQGFIDEEKSEEVGETVFLYPTIKWNDLELKDDTQYHQMLMQLHDKQVISSQTLLDEIGLNYDQEVKRMRYEQAQLGPAGAALGQGQGMGGGMDMGGGMGGGMPGGAASPEQGGMSMPGMGMGPAGGGGGMEMGGGLGGGGMGAGMAAGSTGKITKKGKGGQESEEEAIPMMPIKLTKIEQDMAVMLEELAKNIGFNPAEFKMQFPIENPKGGKSFTMDFALPSLKMDIECLHPKTSLMTPDGMKLAKNVKNGDFLYDRNGMATKVINTFCSEYDDTVCEVQARGIIPFTITSKHKLLISKPYKTRVMREEPKITRTREYMQPGESAFVEIRNAEPGDYVLFPKKSGSSKDIDSLCLKYFKEGSQSRKEVPDNIDLNADFGRLLGFYTAEGCSSNKGLICLSFGDHEIEYLDEIEVLFSEIFNLQMGKRYSANGSTRIYCSSIVIARFLISHIGKYSYEKRIPDFMFSASDNCKKAYLRSLSEGDGCLRDGDSDHLRVQTSSMQLALGIQKLAATLGVWAPIAKSRDEGTYNIRGRTGKQKALWDIAINFNPKKKVYREDENYFYIRIRSITHQEYEGLVYNFTTEDHTYNIHNIVSKNCDGEVWHSSQEQESTDTERDYLLAQRGWTILRFDDKSIEDSPQQVQATIDSYIHQAMEVGSSKQASQNGKNTHGHAVYFVGIDGRLKDFKNDGSKYYKYLDRVYSSRIPKFISPRVD